MSTQEYRLLVVFGNVALVGLIGLVGYRTYAGVPLAPNERPPKDFNPTRYAIQSETAQHSPIDQHRITWLQLDRPKPPPPVQHMKPTKITHTIDPGAFQRDYSLLMASYDPKAPQQSTVILEDRSLQHQVTLSVGDTFGTFQVADIEIHGQDDSREAVLTVVVRGGKRTTITLKQKPPE